MLSYNEDTGEGNGFSFFNYNAHDMLHTIERALDFYRNKPVLWRELQRRGMSGDYSWTHSAAEYLNLYQRLLEGPKPAEKKETAEPNPVVVDI